MFRKQTHRFDALGRNAAEVAALRVFEAQEELRYAYARLQWHSEGGDELDEHGLTAAEGWQQSALGGLTPDALRLALLRATAAIDAARGALAVAEESQYPIASGRTLGDLISAKGVPLW